MRKWLDELDEVCKTIMAYIVVAPLLLASIGASVWLIKWILTMLGVIA